MNTFINSTNSNYTPVSSLIGGLEYS